MNNESAASHPYDVVMKSMTSSELLSRVLSEMNNSPDAKLTVQVMFAVLVFAQTIAESVELDLVSAHEWFVKIEDHWNTIQ